MTLLAHAIGGPVFAAPTPGGLRGRSLRRIASPRADLGLWATGWDGPPGPLDRTDALAHHGIVAAIAAAGPCLPVRFGSWVADDAAAAALLADRRDALAAALVRVTGRSELAVTLLWRERPTTSGERAAMALTVPVGVASAPGRRFLEARRRALGDRESREAVAEALAGRLIELLVELGIDQADVRHEICRTEEVALSLSALVPSARAIETKAAAARLAAALEGVRGVVSGPWPPYSFTPELG